MGTLQLSELRDEILAHLAGRDDISDARITRAINLSQTRMARKMRFEEFEFFETFSKIHSGTKSIDRIIEFSDLVNSNPRDFWSIVCYESGGNGRERKLVRKPTREMDKIWAAPEVSYLSTEMPHTYVVWDEKIELFPIMNQSYSFDIRGYKWPTALSADTDVSEFKEKDDCIINLTTSYLFGTLGEYERQGRFFNIYIDMMQDAMKEEDKPDETLAVEMRPHVSRQWWNDPWIKGIP